MKTDYKTMTDDFADVFAPAFTDRTAFISEVMKYYGRLGSISYAKSLDHWLDQLNPTQLRLLHAYELSGDEARTNVLGFVCYQFLVLTATGERIDPETIRDHHAAAAQRVAEKVGWEL